jgi:hypothetical protein
MTKVRWLRTAALLAVLPFGSVLAQGVTTGAIGGVVTSDQGQPVANAQVQVILQSTGVSRGAITRDDGQYLVQGLEPGGPYTVRIRRIGFAPGEQNGLTVSLSQTLRIDFKLQPQAAQIAGVTVVAATAAQVISPTKTGVGTAISDSAIHRFPTLNRDFTDFAKLAPQISTTGNGLSGGGINNRYNNIQIDGASESDLFGLGSNGRPGDQAGAKSISLEAVKEYQVLLSPFDVRQGNFAGVLINAVTKSGSNELHGSAFYYGRNQSMTRSQEYLTDFSLKQYGFSLGGPIIKNRAFFFVAPEFQQQQLPSSGPFLGSSDSPVTAAQVDQFNAALQQYGFGGGSGGLLNRENPLQNIFGRVDVNLTSNTRIVLRHNYGWARNDVFGGGGSRDPITSSAPTFALTSNLYGFTSKKNSTVGQVFTNFSNGAYNELNVGYTTINDFRTIPQETPQITVTVPRVTGTGFANLVAGTEQSSQGNALDQKTLELSDNFTIPFGSHNVTIGTKNIFYESANLFASNRFGTWAFSSLDSLNRGIPSSYMVSVAVPAGTDGYVRMRQATYGVYAEDQWAVTPRVNVTYGLRLDIPTFRDQPLYNPSVDSAYGRNTAEVPSGNIQYSPRVGFNWDVTGDQRNQVRGGIGLFTGSPAYVWISNAFSNSGLVGTPGLTCSNTNPTNANYPPVFTPASAKNPPTSCGGTNPTPASARLSSAVNTLAPDLRFPQEMKASVGYDHAFDNGIVATVEGLYSRSVYQLFYRNLALAGPQGTDAHGRVMYGTITGSSANAITQGGRTQVYDAKNASGDYSYNITGGLQKRFSNRWEGSLFYTYSQARDLQSTLNSTASSNFNQGRTVSGDLNDESHLARSKWEQPHRILASVTYALPTKTDISVIYAGTSGAPYDYTYRTDENADGSRANDLLYVPKSTTDPNEILFTGYDDPTKAASVQAQQQAFAAFINRVGCLRDQAGHLMGRMTCRAPWRNLTNVAIRQAVPTLRGQNVSVQLDIFNFANLLNKDWGRQREVVSPGLPSVGILSRTGTATQNGKTVGVYTFDTGTPFSNALNAESNYRMQLSVRYSF